MKTRTLVLMLLLAATVSSLADSQRLVVWQKSGQKVYFDLTEEPETTFEDGNLVIRSSRTTVSYPLTNVLRYTYEGGTITDVGDVKMRPGEVRFLQNAEQMAFDGLQDGTILEVYTLDGVKIKTVKAQGGQRTVVSLADQAAGTYIVKAGEATYKFMKR
ncbi:MAG: T9SS type A sorting domain-containing protein [Bacteroidaceae bacterium]|nr:T9SS type A sorting domain-containing protein [Bacteroidaceae bacterium]MBR3373849.1 T9SS type A sorting domain-containing protein [Bacteroidaceae bacterium]MBR4650057.1 T9SS type A sorting domain-containing protein [Bacteroidaceae bacterium]MBR6714340.1 T9SS type A sorting domain-containing protein [Bacteroidaceae bacterium]